MAERAQLFMKLQSVASGDLLQGESEVEGFENQIELDDWEWTLDREQGKNDTKSLLDKESVYEKRDIVPSIFSFSKRMDKSTTALLNYMSSGKYLHAVVTLTETSRSQDKVFKNFDLVISLTKIRVTSYELTGKVNDKSGELTEDWEFNYEEILFDYKAPGKPGRAQVTLKRKPGATTDAPVYPDPAVGNKAISDDDVAKWAKEVGSRKISSLFKKHNVKLVDE